MPSRDDPATAPVVLGTQAAFDQGDAAAQAEDVVAAAEKPLRVLVLGSIGHPRAVAAYEWHALPTALNVGDYDVVIMDLTRLAEEDYPPTVDQQNLPGWPQWVRAMFGQTTIIAMGEPGLRLGTLDAYYWLPYRPAHTWERGREVEPPDDEAIAGYFEAVGEWAYYWESQAGYHECDQGRFLAAVHPALETCELHAHRLAETRTRKALALQLTFRATMRDGRIPQGQVFQGDVPSRSQPVLLLPPATAWTPHEAATYWLRQLGVAAEHEPPGWTQQFVLPNELPLLERAKELHAQLEECQQALADVAAEQAEAGRWRALLYESGDALELIVRDALAALGATVTPPAVAGREDGRLTDPAGRAAVLEIKGLGKSIKLDHVRQLHQWVADVLAEDGVDAKGVLIANVWASRPPPERNEVIAAATLKLSERWGQCVLTTTQLFAALVADQQGQLEREAFWNAIFDSNGLPPLPEP